MIKPHTAISESTPLCERLHHFINDTRAIDCHDHILPREQVAATGDVLFHLFAVSCLRSVPTDPEATLPTPPYDSGTTWEILSPHLPAIANTTAYRSLVAASKLLYDFDGFPLDEKGYNELRARMASAYRREDWYAEALGNKGKIDAVIWAAPEAGSPVPQPRELFLPAANLDGFLRAYAYEQRVRLEREFHVRIESFNDLVDLLKEAVTVFSEEGAPAFWFGFSRFRALLVGGADSRQVAAVFQKTENEITPEEAKQFQDFVIHFVADRCASVGTPLQIDTGAQENALSIEQSDPCQTTGLVADHTNTRFVFLHGSGPFWRHLGALAKTFPNVYVDGSSLASHSATLLHEVVGEWLELVPVGKMLLWGGNALRVESTIGSLLLTRQVLAEVLAERVDEGFYSEELAFDLARKLLRDMPRRIYRTDEMRIRQRTAMEA